MAERWLTYEEVAAAFHIGKESARTLVKRKRWPRRLGNDSLARIGVPEELIEARVVPRVVPPSDPQDDPGNDPPSDTPNAPGGDPPVIAFLHARVAELTEELRQSHAALVTASERAARVEGLEALLELERKRVEEVRETERLRVEEWKAVADRFAAQTEQVLAAQARHSWWPWKRLG